MSKTKLTILLLVIFLLYLAALLVFSIPLKSETLHTQVVLQVVSNGTEEKLVVPKAVVILRIAPLEGPTAKTPLTRGDTMVCHPSDYVENGISHAGFKCGQDSYVLMGIRYQETK